MNEKQTLNKLQLFPLPTQLRKWKWREKKIVIQRRKLNVWKLYPDSVKSNGRMKCWHRTISCIFVITSQNCGICFSLTMIYWFKHFIRKVDLEIKWRVFSYQYHTSSLCPWTFHATILIWSNFFFSLSRNVLWGGRVVLDG